MIKRALYLHRENVEFLVKLLRVKDVIRDLDRRILLDAAAPRSASYSFACFHTDHILRAMIVTRSMRSEPALLFFFVEVGYRVIRVIVGMTMRFRMISPEGGIVERLVATARIRWAISLASMATRDRPALFTRSPQLPRECPPDFLLWSRRLVSAVSSRTRFGIRNGKPVEPRILSTRSTTSFKPTQIRLDWPSSTVEPGVIGNRERPQRPNEY